MQEIDPSKAQLVAEIILVVSNGASLGPVETRTFFNCLVRFLKDPYPSYADVSGNVFYRLRKNRPDLATFLQDHAAKCNELYKQKYNLG